MARTNYSYQKYKRELDKKKKKEEKLQRRLARKQEASGENTEQIQDPLHTEEQPTAQGAPDGQENQV